MALSTLRVSMKLANKSSTKISFLDRETRQYIAGTLLHISINNTLVKTSRLLSAIPRPARHSAESAHGESEVQLTSPAGTTKPASGTTLLRSAQYGVDVASMTCPVHQAKVSDVHHRNASSFVDGVAGSGLETQSLTPPDIAASATEAVVSATDGVTSERLTVAKQKDMSELDGPPGKWPLIGNFLLYLLPKNQGKMHEVQAQLHKKHGKMFREKWGTKWQVHIADPDLIEEVCRKESRYPNRPSIQAWVLYRTLAGIPNGLMTGQGPDWHRYRTEISKRMLSPKSCRALTQPFSDVSNDLVARLRHVRDVDGDAALARSLMNEMNKWSLEAAGTFLFERRLGCLQSPVPPRTQRFIDAAQLMLSSSLYLIVWEKLHQRLNLPTWRRHKHAWDTLFEIGKEMIDERRLELERNTGSAVTADQSTSGVFLTHLLSSKNLSMPEVYSNATDLLVAATDTVANSVCFIAYLLASNQAAQSTLHDEISQVLCGRRDITSDDLEKMKYLNGVIKEALRLYPIITMNCRILQDDIVLDGYHIPKDTLFVMNHYALSRDEDLFARADEFRPERWIRDSPEGGKQTHPFACLPFGHGSRSCVGKRIAMMELSVLTTKIVQNFKLETIPGQKLKPMLSIFLMPGKTVPVRLVDR